MTIGSALFLIAAGAILRYGVKDKIESVNLEVIGLILMIVGVIGLIFGAWQARRADAVVVRDGRPGDRY